MAATTASRWTRLLAARPWLAVATLGGIAAGMATPADWIAADATLLTRLLVGWNAGQWLYLTCVLVLMARADVQGVRGRAQRLDQSGWIDLTLAALGPVMSLAAIVFELLVADGSAKGFTVALTGVTIVGAWLGNATIFAMHYANLYYQQPVPPQLRFPDDELEPDYWDFLYFSFTIAVAQQTADVAIASRAMRKTVLAQALLSYLFNLAILALCINIASNLLATR